MKYDPVKKGIGSLVNRAVWLRKLFYLLLDILLLRTWHVKRALRKFNRLNKYRVSILDAGSGFGQYSWRMSKMNRQWHITGVDVKTEQIDDCNRFFGKTSASDKVIFEYADLIKYRTNSSFDLILSVDVMEHIEEDMTVFHNFFNSLKPGGWLIISTPSDKGGSDVHHHHDDSFIDEHVRDGYGIDDITGKLSGAGFKKITTRYTYGTPGKISWKLSMKIPILLLNLSPVYGIILPIWYLIIMPFALILNWLDTTITHKEGTGLLIVAIKE
ncbi:MAG: class I SAM-dependent methyltransferase [Bacteroidales bacterium]|nr:class I SAM-dependent methyltransferase [Bacteroidales bacterium]